MTQLVGFARYAPKDKAVGELRPRISANVEHITAMVAHSDGGTLLRFGGGGERVDEECPAVMLPLNRRAGPPNRQEPLP